MRTGARLALDRAGAAGDAPIAELLKMFERDEARWCAILLQHIRALGDAPSPVVFAFYKKAMAISDLCERIAFLKRDQSWVARKLREALPRVRDSRLRADLPRCCAPTRLISPSSTMLLATTERDRARSPIARNSFDSNAWMISRVKTWIA